VKRHPTEWERIFSKYINEMGMVPGIYKELQKLNSKTSQF
jgi:hypothetical protein